ncbi:thioredoxin family protein [bacterium]|nr:thioredoxin family protein [bacterium]
MKKNILVLLSFLLPVYSGLAGETLPGFHNGDAESAFNAAKQKNQIVMIDFFTTWCGPCKLLDKNIYQNEAFKAYTEKMVCYKIDAEKGEGIDLANKYNIRVYPSVVFTDASGKEIERKIGYDPDLSHYLKEMDRILDGKDVLPKWIESFEKEKSFSPAVKIANYFMVYDMPAAEPYYRFVLEADKNREKKETMDLMANYAINQLYYGKTVNRTSYAEEFIQQFPNAEPALNLMVDLSFYFARNGQKEKAWDLFTKRFQLADDNGKKFLSDQLKQIKLLTDHATKEETYEAIASLDLNAASDVSKAAGWYQKWNDLPMADKVLRAWLKNNPTASLDDLNNVGWTAFELKIAPSEFAQAMIRVWNDTPASEQDAYKADTIANLCELSGDKPNAVRFGELAVKLIPEKSRMRKEFEQNLKRYKAMH